MKTNIYCNHGSYNWADPAQKQWCVELRTSYGRVSTFFDDNPYVDDLLPSEVLDIIEERINSYWLSTSRQEDMKAIAKIRGHIVELDKDYIQDKIEKYKMKIQDLESLLEEKQ